MPLPVDPSKYIVFLSVMAAMAFTPGPANLFCIATGMQRGKRAALIGVLGLNAGTLIWFAAAALGLGTLIAAFPGVFHALTYAGALYVLWLGIGAFREAFSKKMAPLGKTKKLNKSSFFDGMMVQTTNPKALLFFTAVLPPFMDVSKPVLPQLLMFGIATIGMDVIAMSAYGLGGAAMAKRAENTKFRRGFSFAVGLLLLTAAALIAVKG